MNEQSHSSISVHMCVMHLLRMHIYTHNRMHTHTIACIHTQRMHAYTAHAYAHSACIHTQEQVPWDGFWCEIELGLKEAIKAEVRSGLKKELQAKLNAWRYKFRLVFEDADEDGTGVAQAVQFAVS